MFAIEHVCYIESHHYQLVEHRIGSYPVEFCLFLIRDEEEQKYNYYVTTIYFGLNANYIVKNCEPFPLKDAQRAFPEYNLNELNYGF